MTDEASAPADEVHVLLVEDNPGDVRLTQEAFAAVPTETTIHVATDGDEALEFLTERHANPSTAVPDLVLLDLNLPRMDGFEFLEAIQGEPAVATIPIIVLTSSEATEDVRESYAKCANAYLTKPTDPDAFVSIASAVERFWFDEAALPPVPS
ncbi:response regulator [Halosolutus gelatinilyticus]|uniref:response regulator n=1 Tax=Halosolutus gelatinilyticus TaxID=2931975 RepID=UPI001FF6AD9B|nr:response regulator [Halosolutus gelatinilyticus]